MNVQRGGIDPAALAGATLAGAVSIFGPEGPYKPPSIIIGVILIAILTAYDIEPFRDSLQSIAFSAVFGLAIILSLGAILEVFFGWCYPDHKKENPTISVIPDLVIFLVWGVGTISTFYIDRNRVKKSIEKANSIKF